MKKYWLIIFFLPLFSIAQDSCYTVIPTNNNADSIVYCVTNATCYDTCNGVISITVYGANQPYFFEWFNNSTPWQGVSTQDTLCPGDYIITITDVNGNLVDNSHINQVNGPPNFSVFTNALNNPTCFNANNGSIDLTINGGTPFSTGNPYTYLWEEGTATEDRTLLDSGIYILSMTDAKGCNRIDSFELFNPAEVISETITDILPCIGACNGEAIVTPSDGVAPYTYQWSNGDTDSTATGLCYGTNTVTITDVNGCIAENTVIIANPDTLKLSNITIDNACYQTCDGQISVSIEGGQSPYTTAWSFGGSIVNLLNDNLTNNDLCPGNYQLIFTDANGCDSTVIIPLIERDPFLLASSVINDSCYNSCTGQITVELLNQDSPPFDYYWMPDGQTDSLISNLCSDTFELILIDARLCKDTFEFFVDEPDSLSYDTIIVTHNLCYGEENGAITIGNLTGGVIPITYSWSNGDTSTIPGISSLPADMYSVHIEDANECAIDIANIEVSESDPLYVFYAIVDDSCFGYSDGSITVSISGGNTPYRINGVLLSANDTIISNLAAGQYLYTILDSNDCVRPQDTITVQEPAVLEIDTAIIDVLCHGYHTAAIDLTVEGGSQPYDYQWVGPNGYNSTNEDLNNIGAGNYSVIILDLNLCQISLSRIITEPNFPITADFATSPILCNGGDGNINLSVIGGTPNYSFAWNNTSTNEDLVNVSAGTYTVTILDATNECDTTAEITLTEPPAITLTNNIINLDCFEDGLGSISITTDGGTPQYSFSWDNGETTEDIDSLMAGNYLLIVTDDNSCEQSESFQVEQPVLYDFNLLIDHVSCFGGGDGEINLTTTGGSPPYDYQWVGGNGYSSTNEDLINIPADNYDVIVKDINNCLTSISVIISEPSDINYSVSPIDLICNNESDGEISVTASGGTPAYSYSIDGGTSYQSGNNFTNLQAANYSVWIQDANECKKHEVVVLNEPIGYSTIYNIPDTIVCNGDATGIIDFALNGNTPPYTYSWSNGESSSSISGLNAGNYEVTVSDANNCTMNYSYLVSEPEAMALVYDIQLASCEEKNDGAITTNVTGGTIPIYYQWGTGESSASIFNLNKGTYSLYVEDSKGCSLPTDIIEVGFDGFNGCIEIPTGFTPNNDNIHDEWVIYGLIDFPDAVVKVYNRWGQEIFSSSGYQNPWDGKYNGVDLPTAAYYYVIELNESDKVFNGTVTIKR